MMAKSKDLSGIDLVKWIMAFAVIAIHAPQYLWPENRSWPFILDWFIRLAVPFFFAASGYLVERQLETIDDPSLRRSMLLHRALKVIKIWACWSLLYLPLTIWGTGIADSEDAISDISSFMQDLLLSGHVEYSQPLWFLYSMAAVLLIWAFCDKLVMGIPFGLFAILAAMLHCGFFDKSEVLQKIAIWILGGGLPVFGGALLRKLLFRRCIQSISMFQIVIMLLIASILVKWQAWPYWTLLGGIGLLLLGLLLSRIINNNLLALRQQSMWIYYLHMWIIAIFMIVRFHIDISLNKWIIYVCVCVVTWLASYGISRIVQYPRLSFLKFLIK